MPIPLLAAGAATLGRLATSTGLARLNPFKNQMSLLGGGSRGAAGGTSPMDLLGNVANVASLASLLPSGGSGGSDKTKSSSGVST